ncbi:hypothetical protein P3X46_000996 [Hevea brasiliensis]|uniref:Endonuclease/exonuclease/phosphatase domain-containing protein n=1 Tax=Hevea brasiliensis TaxID=3981 RepID=A0ABQ9NDR3_HEVBR|nr:uncharacterized protein LOC131183285 [Hevea brasiliensis]KAJ9189741.1 hypothetical protein P3X46_000996 [Hevea brasiliensis]
MIISDNSHRDWRLTGFYGFPERGRRRESWNLLTNLAVASSLPWICIGDFNDLLVADDKRGGYAHPNHLYQGFKNVIKTCKLHDVPLEGCPFTWERGRGTQRWVEERLDRAFLNVEALQMFPDCRLFNLQALMSDHSPILLELDARKWVKASNCFRFESAWLRESKVTQLIQTSWASSTSNCLIDKLNNYGKDLADWGKNFIKRFKHKKKVLEKKINRCCSARTGLFGGDLISLNKEMQLLLQQEEDF